jgi:hypothetical protein
MHAVPEGESARPMPLARLVLMIGIGIAAVIGIRCLFGCTDGERDGLGCIIGIVLAFVANLMLCQLPAVIEDFGFSD